VAMASVGFVVGSVVDEFRGVELGDRRLDARLGHLVGRLMDDPSKSFPEALVTVKELEAGYRFFGNDDVDAAAILAPHRARTWGRAKHAKWVLSLEDTTEMRFGGSVEREELGPLLNGGHGFYLHTALLASLDEGAERAIPLGVPAYEMLVRSSDKPALTKEKASANPNKESLRWNRLMAAVDAEAEAHGVSVVHVADREAGNYDLLAAECARGGRFVVRIQAGFATKGVRTPVASGSFERTVSVSAKPTGRGPRKVPGRGPRIAKLLVTACEIAIPTPRKGKHPLPLRRLNLVEVQEVDPPEDEPGVNWRLLTTEPVLTVEDLARVVDSYRARWLIEEYFKALKTGCAFEARQLMSRHALENALAVLMPMAWHMLLLRGVARDAPATPADQLVSPAQYRLLLHLAKPANNRWGIRLGRNPDATELLYAIARMGGHLRNNGTPGWITLRRGMDKLYHLEAAAEALGVEM
jgi:hypothetical protein